VDSPTTECPSPTPGTLLLTNHDDGYCLLYPDGYSVVYPIAGEVCLVPGTPLMACHSTHPLFNVENAAGRTAGQVADESIAALPGFPIQRTSLMIAGEEATVLVNYPGVDIQRLVFLVRGERL